MKTKTGIELIAEERQEQIEKHGFNAEHDAKHNTGDLADMACMCAAPTKLYYMQKYANEIHFRVLDRLDRSWNLPINYHGNVLLDNKDSSLKQRIHQLKVAGALIAAEIDRLQSCNP